MLIMAFIIIIGAIPIIMFLWSVMDKYRGKIKKINWKTPLFIFLTILAFQFIISIFLKSTYQLPIFPNFYDTIIVLILAGVILIVMLLVSLLVFFSLRNVNVPKSIHNPKLLPIITISLPLLMFVFSYFIFPFAGKLSYVYTIETAQKLFHNETNQEEISLKLVQSEKKCLRRQSLECRNKAYDNLLFVKNTTSQKQTVQFQIHATDVNGVPEKIILSDIMNLNPGEIQVLTTEETDKNTSPWNVSSFQTNKQLTKIEYMYKIMDEY